MNVPARSRSPLLVPLLLAAFLSAPRPAEAFTCTPVTDANGVPAAPAISQAWVNRCIPYRLERGANLFSGEVRRDLVRQSFAVWQTNACSDMEFVDLGYTDQTVGFDPAASDNQNVLTSIDDAGTAGQFFPDPNMVAITITAFSTASGEIFDADIVVNTSGFRFEEVDDAITCQAQNPLPFDLRSILIHEMGHFIGFDHSEDTESTMFFSAPACETKKRTLTDDDILGICTVYARNQPPKTCAEPPIEYDSVAGSELFRDQCGNALDPSDGGCRCAAPGEAWPGAGWLALGGLLLLRRRRRSA